MVLSNYKYMHIRIQDPEILNPRFTNLFQQLQVHSSNVSSNRIKIHAILLILQLETDYFSKLFISEMHSKQWHYSLHRDFQNCYSTRRSPTGFFSSNSSSKSIHPSTYNLHVHITLQRILHPESISTCRRQRALRVLLLYSRGQRDLHSRKRNSMYRRQGDLLEIHPCVLQDIPGIPATRPSKGIQLLQTFQSFQTFQTFRSFQSFQTFQSLQRHSGHSSHS